MEVGASWSGLGNCIGSGRLPWCLWVIQFWFGCSQPIRLLDIWRFSEKSQSNRGVRSFRQISDSQFVKIYLLNHLFIDGEWMNDKLDCWLFQELPGNPTCLYCKFTRHLHYTTNRLRLNWLSIWIGIGLLTDWAELTGWIRFSDWPIVCLSNGLSLRVERLSGWLDSSWLCDSQWVNGWLTDWLSLGVWLVDRLSLADRAHRLTERCCR